MFRFLVGGAVAVVLVLSFLVTRVLDELAPVGSTDIVTVWDQSAPPSGSFQALVERTAVANGMTILKEVRTESGPAVVRHEYVANLREARAFQVSDHDVTGFDPTLITRFRPISELSSNRINGTYLTDAGTAAANGFAASLREQGVTVTVHPLSPVSVAFWVASEVPAVPLGAALLLVVLAGVVAWQASRRNSAAISASFGRNLRRSSYRDAAGLAAVLTAGGLVGMAASAAALLAFNGAARSALFLTVSAAGLALVICFALVVFLIAAACTRASLTRVINGARPWRSVLTVALLGNVIALAFAGSAATTAWQSITLAASDSSERGMWRSSLDHVRLNFFSSNAELDAAEPELAALFTRLDAAGAVVLADHVVNPDLTSHEPNTGNVLLVNSQYLNEQVIQEPSGTRITPAALDPNALTLLVPEGVRVSERDKHAWEAFLRFQRGNATNPEVIPATIRVTTLLTTTPRVFTYATDDLWSTSSAADTVVAVLPSATPSMSANMITSNMTTGEVVFTDPELLRADLAAHHLTLAEIEPLRNSVSYRSVVIERALWQSLAAVGVLVLVLGVSAAVTAHTLTMIWSRRTMIVRTHGRSMVRAVGSSLALPLAVLASAGSVLVATTAESSIPIVIGSVVVDALVVIVATAIHGIRLARPRLRRP
ncbi:hypothetical protein [Curtobacterium ammoniigenes]|uniref:hypothetical protein n=1 Tax=Curtobacterium ammoniigenes TaxID=395387 RepID=UPI00082AB20D|nr:hypothetical protein [Curtobacterium ammoniigenes]